MTIYRPRWAVRIDVPVESNANALGGVYAPTGTDQDALYGADASTQAPGATTGTISIMCPVRRFEFISNSHLEADVLSCIVDWKLLGVDPRVLSSAIVTLYVWEAAEGEERQPKDGDIRFVGVMKRSKRVGSEEQGLAIEVLAHDFTAFFLEAKKFPTDGMPLYSMTVSEAWGCICDHTGYINPANPSEILPSVKNLRNRIQFIGDAQDVLIGTAVTGRMSSLGGHVNVDPKSDAWGVWQKTIGMLGLISFIYLDVCYVTTATDYYTVDNPPTLVWGLNIAEMCEDRDTTLCGKGLHLQSFNPLTGTQLESFYPPIGDQSILKHKIAAKAKNKAAAALNASDYEHQSYPGVSSQAALDAICEQNYIVMAHQELEGRIITHEMSLDTADGIIVFDMLTLRAGDAVQVKIDQNAYDALGDLPTDTAKINYLVGRGYDDGLARIVVANLNGILALSPVYIVKRVTISAETTEEGGRFVIEVTYCSRIQANGTSLVAA